MMMITITVITNSTNRTNIANLAVDFFRLHELNIFIHILELLCLCSYLQADLEILFSYVVS
jgi:hypothetical protein